MYYTWVMFEAVKYHAFCGDQFLYAQVITWGGVKIHKNNSEIALYMKTAHARVYTLIINNSGKGKIKASSTHALMTLF